MSEISQSNEGGEKPKTVGEIFAEELIRDDEDNKVKDMKLSPEKKKELNKVFEQYHAKKN